MWKRFAEQLRCPVSAEPLRLVTFEDHQAQLSAEHAEAARRAGVATDAAFTTYVDSGLLVSERGLMYPIANGVPVMLPYVTPIHEQFASMYSARLAEYSGHRFPSESPAPGEQDVFRSFSEEWREYKYDGVLWDVS